MIKSVSWSALKFDLGSSCIGLLEVGKNEIFGPVLRPGFWEYQIRLVENTVTTDDETGQHCLSNITVRSLVTLFDSFRQQPNLHGRTGKHAQKNQHSLADHQKTFACWHAKHAWRTWNVWKFGGGKTSKQGQVVETISCQANNVSQFRQPLRAGRGLVVMTLSVQCRIWRAPGFSLDL